MDIVVKEEEIKDLVEAWEGHIERDTHCSECKDKKIRCPINNFFMKLKKFYKTKK